MPRPETHIRSLDDEFTIDDVGSTLLEQLAKGLYQSYEVIREYVQNAVDAHRLWRSETGTDPEGPIQIEIHGNTVNILDYGIGMDEDEIRKVKSIAVSRKRDTGIELTGYKGVGIWAGLSYFKTLKLYSTKRGSDKGYELTIHFKAIVDAISDETSIGDALNPNYAIDEYEEDPAKHYTTVSLEEPTRSADWFLDPEKVGDAVRRICPCQIDETFVFHDELTDWYARHGFELFSIKVDGEPIYRSYPSAVERFDEGSITIDDKPVAQYWRAVHKANRKLTVKEDQLAGFRVVQNGFVLGGNNLYSDAHLSGFDELTVQTYLDWHIGEIHVTLPDLLPDLPRRNFEESELTRQFIQRLRSWYQDAADDTRVLSDIRKSQDKYAEYENVLRELSSKGAPLILDSEDRDRLVRIHDDLTKQERTWERNKHKQKVGYQVKAIREIRPERRKLLHRTREILDSVPGLEDYRDEELLDIDSVGETSTDFDDQQVDKVPAAPLEESPVQDALATIEVDWDQDASDGSHQILVDVVLGLLEEVLREELPDSPDLRSTIISKLQRRIQLVSSHVE